MRRIVINPSTFKNGKDSLAIAWNERLRIWMEENGYEPRSEVTDAQREFLSDTGYADDEVQLRRTVLARIATLDTSVKDPTDEQVAEVLEILRKFKETEEATNENEAIQLDRLIELVRSALGTPAAQPAGAE